MGTNYCDGGGPVTRGTANPRPEKSGFDSHPSLHWLDTMDEKFKEEFWKWFDKLPEKTKRSYIYSHLDVAEEYFREFFYEKS